MPITTTPKWNINIVLRYLQSGDFYPLQRLDFPSLTRRTAFLLLFASAARISEATAWSAQVDFVRGSVGHLGDNWGFSAEEYQPTPST
jgi:hypothetical protein